MESYDNKASYVQDLENNNEAVDPGLIFLSGLGGWGERLRDNFILVTNFRCSVYTRYIPTKEELVNYITNEHNTIDHLCP